MVDDDQLQKVKGAGVLLVVLGLTIVGVAVGARWGGWFGAALGLAAGLVLWGLLTLIAAKRYTP
jgi:hypothetical protein